MMVGMIFSLFHAADIADGARWSDLAFAVHHTAGRADALMDVGILADEPFHRDGVNDTHIGTDWLTVAPELWPDLNARISLENQRHNLPNLLETGSDHDTIAGMIGRPPLLFHGRNVEYVAAIFVEERCIRSSAEVTSWHYYGRTSDFSNVKNIYRHVARKCL